MVCKDWSEDRGSHAEPDGLACLGGCGGEGFKDFFFLFVLFMIVEDFELHCNCKCY